MLIIIQVTVTKPVWCAYNVANQNYNAYSEISLRIKLDSTLGLIKKWRDAGDKEKEIRALKETGSICQMLNSFDTAVIYYEKAAELALKGGYKELYSSVTYNLGIVYSSLGQYQKALENGLKALETDRELGKPENVAASLNCIAIIYQRWSMLDKALEYQLQSIKISEETKNLQGIAEGYYNLGNIYNKLNRQAQALEYFNQAKEQYQLLLDKDSTSVQYQQGLSETYYSIAEIFLTSGHLEQADKVYNIALEIKKKTLDRVGISNVYNQLGNINVIEQNYNEAIGLYSESLRYKQLLNDKKGMAIANYSIGNVYYRLNDYRNAEDFLGKSIAIASSIGDKEVLKQAYLFLSNLFELKNNSKKALYYHKLYKIYADSVFNDNTSKVVEELNIKFETEKKEKENKILQLTVQKQKTFGFFLVGIILLVLIILVIIYILYRSKQKTNKIISYKNQLLGEQNVQINNQKIEIEKKNHDLTDSIKYAQRIQASLLADTKKLHEYLPDAFIFLRPKDIVSGDFYWFREKNGRFIFSAVDCTGHGVPGAFMSMLGSSFLDKIVDNRGVTSPELILNELNTEVQSALKQSETHNQDGMDMALCSIDLSSKTVEYTGAKNPLVYVKNNELVKIKADKFPIGRSTYESVMFTKQTVIADTPTCFYMFSDGYGDQFGGPENRKFMSKNMGDMFLEIHQRPFAEQKTIVENRIIEWMNGKEQIDDILVVGFKIG